MTFGLICLSQLMFINMAICQEEVLVRSMSELVSAVETCQAGTEIIMADGFYSGETVLQSGQETAKDPLVIRAENVGKAVIGSTLTLKGSYISLIGCLFQEQGNIIIEGNGCRLSQCTFSDSKATKWVRVRPGSSSIEIDHNLFENKTINQTEKSCQLMQIIVLNQDERHHIHHNLFRDIPQGSGNGYETLQLITKGNPFDPPPGDCNTVIENNLFVRCNGEAEVISVKSNGNLLRGNTFRACRGSLVFRHGDNNTATQNCFFGDGEDGSGGIRLQGTDQVVANNYFNGLGQFGIGMMDGTPDDLYIQVERAQILFNTFVNCRPSMVIGISHPRHPKGTTPKDCMIAGNIFYAGRTQPLFEFVQDDPAENWTWADNTACGDKGMFAEEGLRSIDPQLEFLENGMAYPTQDTPTANREILKNKLLTTDLLGQKRTDNTTLGAIQYPAADQKKGYLTEEMVGPNAK
jgi:poly(beta-D-mannuronate) lyase